ncbi:hypothetical protein HELRODRAFT_105374 [Helobdella robusta]|uniref:Plastin-2 n=1 Tax=Helobdella robusta TaxID=6412 RepID=T1EDU2_HELRO|nr:hypothetical protein HELRODRAFT_105374 [Helobdella robusta]ESO12477.1 hypothetical protein HELRODRAFT_105374 [Helobdella robusta]
MSAKTVTLSKEEIEEITTAFQAVDINGDGSIKASELQEVLNAVNIKLPGYKVRQLIEKHDTIIRDDQLNFEEFKKLYAELKHDFDFSSKLPALVKKSGITTFGGMSQTSAEGTTHTVRNEEQVAFANWINKNFGEDPECKKYLPINPDNNELFTKCNDGVLYCKLVNNSQPGTVDERTINRAAKLSIYQIHENLNLALNSASSIGCNIINIGPDDLYAGKPHLVLGLLWQIIRYGLLANIDLHNHPGLAALLLDGESLEDFMKLSPEQILIRWVNYHLARSNCGRQIANLTGDIKDSVAYIHLLHQIAPPDSGITTHAEHEHDLHQRAERMLQEAEKIQCRAFVSPDDVVRGNYKLNLAFVANLFNMYPALDQAPNIDLSEIHPETREEKMYRNWMNSIGVSPYVSRIYSDLTDGLIIFQLYDIIKSGTVNWNKVIKKFNKMKAMMEKIENCNYAVELGRECKFSLVGIDGKNIYDGNETLTLALVWQLMKAYTLSMLTTLAGTGHPVLESEIVTWVNNKLQGAGKSRRITGFNDPTISSGRVVLDLVDACKPGSINYDLVKQGDSEEEKLSNAQYAISAARKIGARVYALPEDIVEVKSKMVLTIFACLMIRDYQPAQKR